MTTRDAMRAQLRIKPADVEAVNAVLAGEENALVGGLLDLVEKYGGVAEINRKADVAGQLETRLARLQDEGSPFLAPLRAHARWISEGDSDSHGGVLVRVHTRLVEGTSCSVNIEAPRRVGRA